MATTQAHTDAESKGLMNGWRATSSKGRWTYTAPWGETFSSLSSAKTSTTPWYDEASPAEESAAEEERPASPGTPRQPGASEEELARAREAAAAATPVLPHGAEGLSEYELERLARIARNEAFMRSLGLGGGLAAAAPAKRSAAAQRGVSRKKARAPTGPPRRSPRVAGNAADGAQLPPDHRDQAPSAAAGYRDRPRETGDFTYRIEDFDDDAEAAAEAERLAEAVAGAEDGERAALDAKAYAASLRAMRLEAVDVTKVTKQRTYALAWQPREDRLIIAAGDKDGRLGLWDVDEADGDKCCWELCGAHARPVTGLEWRGANLLSGGYDSLVREVRLDHAPLKSIVVADYDRDDVDDLTHWCLAGATVWGAHKCGGLSRHDTRLQPATKKFVANAHGRKAAHVAARPADDRFVATSSNDGTVKVWDVRKLAKNPTPVFEAEHAKSVHGCAWSADGATLATCSYDDTVGFFKPFAKGTARDVARVPHDNHTGRYLTPFKPVFDVHAPYDVVVMGAMKHPRCVDLLKSSGPLIHLNDKETYFTAVTSIHAVHPLVHIIAGANNSGRLSLWRH